MKKENVIYVIVGLLFIALALVSLLVFFFRKNPQILRHKLKIGLLIIALQSMMFGCGSPKDTTDIVDCYAKPIDPDEMSLVCNYYEEDKYLFDLNENNILQVNVSNRHASSFSFALLDSNQRIALVGSLKPKDLSLNSDWEELTALIDKKQAAGSYILRIYNEDSSRITPETAPQSSYNIRIIKPERD